MKNRDIFIGLGSNIGDRLNYLYNALQAISKIPDTAIVGYSSVYESEPIGFVEQPNFLNMAIHLTSDLTPEQLLKKTQSIETRFGRERTVRWGPRTIDIDILFWGQEEVDTEKLHIPHPEVKNRRFVLHPLAEIAGDYRFPPNSTCIRDILKETSDKTSVRVFMPRENLAFG